MGPSAQTTLSINAAAATGGLTHTRTPKNPHGSIVSRAALCLSVIYVSTISVSSFPSCYVPPPAACDISDLPNAPSYGYKSGGPGSGAAQVGQEVKYRCHTGYEILGDPVPDVTPVPTTTTQAPVQNGRK